MNCQDVRAALLAGESSEAISSHLSGCVECRRSTDDIQSIRADLASDSMWAEPPPGLQDAVVAAILGADDPRNTDAPEVKTQTNRFNRRRLSVALGSVAAILILVVGALALIPRTPAPDWEVAMAGTEVTPSASAVIAGWNVDTGTQILLEAESLGEAPDGFVYQLWFSKGSTDVSAGTFTDPSHVELTVGVARKDYPNVWVSLQPINAGAGGAGPALLHTTDI
ncbi:MAG: anti-sigma factor [Actinomycetia bacterium]|nr:anti-sigma factor [Actinomycetes bacterium]